ncbi:MAG: 30S ribosomal protein S15 [Kiritimatiellae bacterium]|nr:30S ribosomal protein S15 [Kiritimatiellia bacterium]
MDSGANKASIVQEYQLHEKDTGSPEVQVALLSHRIQKLTEHLQNHLKDHSSRYGLIKLVSARRSLLDYIRSKDEKRYRSIIKRLDLRR